jgi:signal transduction histidine kinase
MVEDLLFLAQFDAGSFSLDLGDADLVELAGEPIEAARPAAKAKNLTLALGCRLHVTDTGYGIPAAEQQRLFERFCRSTTASANNVPGTGLGLTIAKTSSKNMAVRSASTAPKAKARRSRSRSPKESSSMRSSRSATSLS